MSEETIDKEYTDFVDGMVTGAAKSDAADPASAKVFDWDKAAEIIRDRKPRVAVAGLAQDWNNTSGNIVEGGEILEDSWWKPYLASAWATPALELDNGELIPCYILIGDNEQEWGSGTYWPDSAREILEEQDSNE